MAVRTTTGLLLLALALPVFARSIAQKKELARTQFEAAERMREQLNSRPLEERTRRDYQRVTDAYRRVYYTAPTSIKADPAAVTVADLLAEAGHRFNDSGTLQAAIDQYEFLRREYPGSKYRVDALFTIATIYKEDLKDREQAKAKFLEFLKRYPQSPLANDAQLAIKELNLPPERSEKKEYLRKVNVDANNGSEQESEPSEAAQKPAAVSLVTGIRHWSTPDYTRVAIDLESGVKYQAGRVPNPDRIFFDLHGTRLATALVGKSFEVQDGFLRKIRISQYQKGITRVVLDVDDVSDYSAFLLPNPYRLIIDIHGRQVAHKMATAPKAAGASEAKEPRRELASKEASPTVALETSEHDKGLRTEVSKMPPNPPSKTAPVPEKRATKVADGTTSPLKFDPPVTEASSSASKLAATEPKKNASSTGAPKSASGQAQNPGSETKSERTTATQERSKSAELSAGPKAEVPPPGVKPVHPRSSRKPATTPETAINSENPQTRAGSDPVATHAAPEPTLTPADAVAKQSSGEKTTPELVKATVEPKSAEGKPGKSAEEQETADATTIAHLTAPDLKSSKPSSAPTFESVAPRAKLPEAKRRPTADADTREARPASNGDRSLIRALGLKIGKIVVDAGHGGHDTGTIGPNGLQEKDLTLDIAVRLGKLLQSKLGADVIYTREDDSFIPLETRTAIANQNEADLFISIHANSSRDAAARGVETYYLNFTSSKDALEVAARENAVSETSIHELQDLVKKIALKEKIEESHEFAAEVQKALWTGLSAKSPALRDRGVKKAPFIVLIGANMPSVLAEVSFLSNPTDERRLKTPEYRQKVAEYLYRGITRYVSGLSGLKVAQKRQ